MFSSFCVVAHGLTCFMADGITAEIMSLNYGGFSKAVTGENAQGWKRVTFGYRGTFGEEARRKRKRRRALSALTYDSLEINSNRVNLEW
jgi:hypothetical protein